MLVASRLRRDQVVDRVGELFEPGAPTAPGRPGQIGVEVELIGVRRTRSLPTPVPAADIQNALAADPTLLADAHITFEPGGQVELSPPPAASVAGLLDQVEALVARVRGCGARAGIEFVTPGLNPWHSVAEVGLQTPKPRYLTMQARYDAVGAGGRRMMRLTAALQVGIDMGTPVEAAERWRLLNAAGPALTAAFANSPLLEGRPSGMQSTRSAAWQDTDPTRTGFDGCQVAAHGNVIEPGAYADFALAAVAIPLPRDDAESAPATHSFSDWLEQATADRPDRDDLEHHLTTLFPPVRPRGHFEVRYLDALPQRWLPVPVAVLAALAYDPSVRRAALEATQPAVPDAAAWSRAARRGVEDPDLRRTALDILDIAAGGIERLPAGYVPERTADLVREYTDRYTRQGRSPAHEQLEAFSRNPEDIETWT